MAYGSCINTASMGLMLSIPYACADCHQAPCVLILLARPDVPYASAIPHLCMNMSLSLQKTC